MTEPTLNATGHCHCEMVRYTVTGGLRDVINCHCDRCRRITGHFMAATSTTSDQISIDDTGTLRWYEVDGAKYGFCSQCGSTLFWIPEDDPTHISIAAGTLDPPTNLKTTKAVFVNEASDYHSLDGSMRQIDTDEAAS